MDALAAGVKNISMEDMVEKLPASRGYAQVTNEQHAFLQNHCGVAQREGWNHASLYSPSLRNFVDNIKKRVYEPEDLAFADEYSRAFWEEHLNGEDVKNLMNKLLGEGGNAKWRVF